MAQLKREVFTSLRNEMDGKIKSSLPSGEFDLRSSPGEPRQFSI
jgi:hypothetical protein